MDDDGDDDNSEDDDDGDHDMNYTGDEVQTSFLLLETAVDETTSRSI